MWRKATYYRSASFATISTGPLLLSVPCLVRRKQERLRARPTLAIASPMSWQFKMSAHFRTNPGDNQRCRDGAFGLLGWRRKRKAPRSALPLTASWAREYRKERAGAIWLFLFLRCCSDAARLKRQGAAGRPRRRIGGLGASRCARHGGRSRRRRR